MKMNRFETWAMNNPLRALIQRRVEAPLLEKMGGHVRGLNVLEVGCGRGVGTEIIVRQFGAAHVTAIDLDPHMILEAKKRWGGRLGQKVEWCVGDLARLSYPDNFFDAVFNFAALHHVPMWRDAIHEIRRVLKPEGRFYFEEATSQFIHRWPWRILFDHPREDRFSAQQFLDALDTAGLGTGPRWAVKSNGDYIFGVGVKSG